VSAFSTVIEAKGFELLRFSNRDVMTNRVGVLDTVATTVAERAPTPTLLRKRWREKSAPVEKSQP
jgi:very-short-patch-repair endonuclease